MGIVPEANFGLESCKNGPKERNATILCIETDYMLSYQTVQLPMPKQLFKFITDNHAAGIITYADVRPL